MTSPSARRPRRRPSLRSLAIGCVLGALLVGGTASADALITGASIADQTISADDLGPDVTRVKSTTVTIPAQDPKTVVRCSEQTSPDVPSCGEYVDSAATTVRRSVRCPRGNVTGGGVRFLDDGDLWNLDVESYPANDSTWGYVLFNNGPDPITVQLRVVCI